MFKMVRKSGSGSRSELFKLLEPDQKSDVLQFVEWMNTSTSFTQNSKNSYKSYVIKGMLKADGKLADELTNDEKSGLRKFEEFVTTKAAKIVRLLQG